MPTRIAPPVCGSSARAARCAARLVVGARGLDQRDRLGERAPVAGAHAGGQRVDARPGVAGAASRRRVADRARSGLRRASARRADLREHVARAPSGIVRARAEDRRRRRPRAGTRSPAAGSTPPTTTTMSSAPWPAQRLDELRAPASCARPPGVETPTTCTSFSIACRAASSGVWNSGPTSTSKPRSAKAVAIDLRAAVVAVLARS